MATLFPYYCISCPCSDSSRRVLNTKKASRDVDDVDEQGDEEMTFDAHHQRSNFSLFPPEHLLYCEECHDIKCPRCVTEEIICTYCPSCLFEVPSSSIKPDYNRCSRNCFCCPICTSQLITTSIGEKADGPYILNCNYCLWSSLDIGIQFDKPQNLRQQMDQRANGGKPKPSYRDTSATSASSGLRNFVTRQGDISLSDTKDLSQGGSNKEDGNESIKSTDPHLRFEALKAFYKDQLANSDTLAGGISGLDSFSSPSSLSRIMNLYTGTGSAIKKSKQRAEPMREANSLAEGQLVPTASSLPSAPQHNRYNDIPTSDQILFQHPHPIGNPYAQHISELRPMPTLLRTKRSKRCAACKHILVKPEFKVTSTRYRIRLVALNYIPFITFKPVPVSGGLQAPGPDGAAIELAPGKPSQWIMTLRNPLFESLKVSLGSPSRTPGKHGHKVTILCPEFTIGKNGDVWDDALNMDPSRSITSPSTGEQIAGKIYDRGRNWTSIVIEVIPTHVINQQGDKLEPDEEIIEIPIRVRLQWTVSDDAETERIRKKSEKIVDENAETDDGKRELAYWMVVGIGRTKR